MICLEYQLDNLLRVPFLEYAHERRHDGHLLRIASRELNAHVAWIFQRVQEKVDVFGPYRLPLAFTILVQYVPRYHFGANLEGIAEAAYSLDVDHVIAIKSCIWRILKALF